MARPLAHRRGGIARVAAAVEEHGDALDFDLYDRWRVRLRDVPDTVGWDAVALFLRHLPRDSATMREIDPHAAWSDETQATVRVYDAIAALMWGLGGGKGERPRPTPMPGDPDPYGDAVPADVNAVISGIDWEED